MPLTTPDSIRLEYELTTCELEKERDVWMDLRARVGRTANLDAHLNGEYDVSYRRIDYLLEELFDRMGMLAVMGVTGGTR